MWICFSGFTTRSNIQRQMARDLKKLINKVRNTIKALELSSFEPANNKTELDDDSQKLIKDALEERIKTESDLISRR